MNPFFNHPFLTGLGLFAAIQGVVTYMNYEEYRQEFPAGNWFSYRHYRQQITALQQQPRRNPTLARTTVLTGIAAWFLAGISAAGYHGSGPDWTCGVLILADLILMIVALSAGLHRRIPEAQLDALWAKHLAQYGGLQGQ